MRIGAMGLLGGAMLTLGACGSSGGGGGGLLAGGPGSKWVKDNACKTVDSAAMAAATGQTVKSATNNTMSSDAAVVATCSYDLSGGNATVMTRISKDDLSDAEIAQMRDAGGLMSKGEDLPGYGMKAFWSNQTHQLQLFADRKHYAGIVYMDALTLPGAPKPKGPDPKAVATSIAKGLL